MADTAIEWTDKTWNPVVGCTKVSPGCKNCYAKTLHDQRHKARGEGKRVPLQYAQPFEVVQLMPDRLRDPLTWKKPQKVFVNSVSDLFHEDVPDDFLDRVFAVMACAGRHTFQVLTKRADRMAGYVGRLAKSIAPLEAAARTMGYTFQFKVGDGRTIPTLSWPIPNVWLGVSVENRQHGLPRIDALRAVPAAVRFLSVEPLLEDLGTIDLAGIQWVIVGGESGRGSRPMHPGWARSLRDQCVAAGVSFFFKQHGDWADYFHVRDELKLPVPTAASRWGSFYPREFDGGHNFVTGELAGDHQAMLRVGKKAAGRLLGGREWNEFPTPAEAR